MFGKVNPAPAVSRCVRMVFRSLLETLKPFRVIKKIPKHDIHENPGYFAVSGSCRTRFFDPVEPCGTCRTRCQANAQPVGFPRIPFLDPFFLLKWFFFMGGPVTYIQIGLNREKAISQIKFLLLFKAPTFHYSDLGSFFGFWSFHP